jgi:hypothetical protein
MFQADADPLSCVRQQFAAQCNDNNNDDHSGGCGCDRNQLAAGNTSPMRERHSGSGGELSPSHSTVYTPLHRLAVSTTATDARHQRLSLDGAAAMMFHQEEEEEHTVLACGSDTTSPRLRPRVSEEPMWEFEPLPRLPDRL